MTAAGVRSRWGSRRRGGEICPSSHLRAASAAQATLGGALLTSGAGLSHVAMPEATTHFPQQSEPHQCSKQSTVTQHSSIA